jgi:preprotein translocase subunit SecE
MILSKKQVETVEKEFSMKSIFEENFRSYSRMLWNELKKDVWVTFKDGHFYKADEKGW